MIWEDQKPTKLATVQLWVWGALWRNWKAALVLCGVVCILHSSFLPPSPRARVPLMSACVPLSPLANTSGLGRDGFPGLPSLTFLKGADKAVGVLG